MRRVFPFSNPDLSKTELAKTTIVVLIIGLTISAVLAVLPTVFCMTDFCKNQRGTAWIIFFIIISVSGCWCWLGINRCIGTRFGKEQLPT